MAMPEAGASQQARWMAESIIGDRDLSIEDQLRARNDGSELQGAGRRPKTKLIR